MTDTQVKINGKSAGPVHQGAFYRFSYYYFRVAEIWQGESPGGNGLQDVIQPHGQ